MGCMCGWGQIAQLTTQISNYEGEVKQLIASANSSTGPPTPSTSLGGREDDEASNDVSDDDDTDEELEDRFIDLEEDLAGVIADVHDLGQSLANGATRIGCAAGD